MFDKLQLVPCPGADVRVELSEAFVKIAGPEIVGHNQQVNVGVAIGISACDGPKEPCAQHVWPRREPLAQSTDQLATETCEGQDGAGREVVSVQHDHR